MAVRLAQMQDAGTARDEHAALAKEYCTTQDARDRGAGPRGRRRQRRSCSTTASAKFFADAEALYSFEGTRQINTLVVGRAITGHSAFV